MTLKSYPGAVMMDVDTAVAKQWDTPMTTLLRHIVLTNNLNRNAHAYRSVYLLSPEAVAELEAMILQENVAYIEAKNPTVDAIEQAARRLEAVTFDMSPEYAARLVRGQSPADQHCAAGFHSWVSNTGTLTPDTLCDHCGEPYGNPD